MLISGKMMLISMKKLPFYKPTLARKPPTEAQLEKQAYTIYSDDQKPSTIIPQKQI
jgi:hypothetical protein